MYPRSGFLVLGKIRQTTLLETTLLRIPEEGRTERTSFQTPTLFVASRHPLAHVNQGSRLLLLYRTADLRRNQQNLEICVHRHVSVCLSASPVPNFLRFVLAGHNPLSSLGD